MSKNYFDHFGQMLQSIDESGKVGQKSKLETPYNKWIINNTRSALDDMLNNVGEKATMYFIEQWINKNIKGKNERS